MNPHITATKQFRKDLDEVLQRLKYACGGSVAPSKFDPSQFRVSTGRYNAKTKIQEAIMWLGYDLKEIDEESPGSAPNPYPESYDPTSQKIDKTSDGLKL